MILSKHVNFTYHTYNLIYNFYPDLTNFGMPGTIYGLQSSLKTMEKHTEIPQSIHHYSPFYQLPLIF
ncbi:BFH_collapsed_G0022400.mRNA.1.CDS.1 [Saccharomyces cerevisiae]|uniref:Uncharacterized protein n=1 Tax=Saccharomyces cerevisiae (strain RM11-1a) TaxID=285006 RepID=B3LHZ9_YEAS1|nr:conserved hypothetical protein [Saccharomyces cerevisiae RM11-1a]CAI7139468.1 BFH_collapsed_G0022400.mRNA.1.CDS.1 [Saccharomyces cerevisiae]